MEQIFQIVIMVVIQTAHGDALPVSYQLPSHPAVLTAVMSLDCETTVSPQLSLGTEIVEDRFPQIWVPSWENRDLRQLLWHRHRMVQARTRMMNQLQAVALNEGLRCKKRLWREHGREQLEAFRLAPWASRRRQDLLQLLDGLNPTIAELTQAIEQEVEKCPEAHDASWGRCADGIGLRSDHWRGRAISMWEANRMLSGTGAIGGLERRAETARAHHQARQLSAAILVSGSGASYGAHDSGMAQ